MPQPKEDDGWWVVVNGVGLTQVWLKGDTTPVYIERQAGLLWYVVNRDPRVIEFNGSWPHVVAGPFEELDVAKVHYLFAVKARGA